MYQENTMALQRLQKLTTALTALKVPAIKIESASKILNVGTKKN